MRLHVLKSLIYDSYLNAYESINEAKQRIGNYCNNYNSFRPHVAMSGNTPEEVYYKKELKQVE